MCGTKAISALSKLDTKAKPGLILVQCELSPEEQETFTGYFFLQYQML